MPRRSVTALTIGVAVPAVLLGACWSGTSAAAAGSASRRASSKTVLVAVEGPLTGTQSTTGQDMVRGAKLAADKLNAHGGVLGHKVKILPVNDRATPTVGMTAAKKAVASSIAAVVGPFNSSVGEQALPVYKAAGVSILRLTSAMGTEGYGVTTQPMSTQIAPVEAREIHGVLHAKSVGILFDPSAYTGGIATQLATLLRKDGVSVPIDRVLSPTAPASTVKKALAAVAATSPGVTYLAMYGAEAGRVAKAMAAAAPKTRSHYGRCFVDLAAQGESFVEGAGRAGSSRCLASGVPSASQLPGGTAYSKAYRAKFHEAPGTWGPFAYDSVGIWAAAATKAHQVSGQTILSDLAATSGYRGVTGTITFQPTTGNRKNPPVVILDVTSGGRYEVNRAWAAAVRHSL